MLAARAISLGACLLALAALTIPVSPAQAQIVGRILGGGKKFSQGGSRGVVGGLRKSGGPLSGGLLGGRRAPARTDNSSGNYARSRETNKQWLSDFGKQGPQVRVGDSSQANAAQLGRAATRPDGVLAKSDLGIATSTAQKAQQAQKSSGAKGGKDSAGGLPSAHQAGALGKSGVVKGETPPGTFQGEGVKSAILTGVVVAASLAQNQQFGDAYDDSWVGPGGGFVNYSEDADGYVYHGYHDGSSAEQPSAPAALADTNQPAAEGTPGLDFTPDEAAPHVVARPQHPAGSAIAPAKNALPNQVTVADRKVARKIAREIDALMASEVDSATEQLAGHLLSDEAREEFLKSHATADMDATIVQELKNGLIDLDADSVERAGKKLSLPPEVVTTLGARVKLTRIVNELRKLIKEGHSLENVAAFSRRFDNSLVDFHLNQGQREALAASTGALLDSLRIRISLDDAPAAGSGELVDAPKGEVSVLYFPPLAPAGKVYLLGGTTLGVGTATPGTLVVGHSDVRELMGVPYLNETPLEAISAERAQQTPRDGTVLLNPSQLGQSISYTINDAPFTIGPGQSQHLPAGTPWVIKLDRGDGTLAHYSLAAGAYVFTADNGVRDVTSLPCEVTIENPSLTGRFNLLVDHEAVSIPPGQALSLSSSYPIVVAFDRGVSSDPAYKRLTRGTLSAGINSADGGWDLFAADAAKRAEPEQASAETPVGVQ